MPARPATTTLTRTPAAFASSPGGPVDFEEIARAVGADEPFDITVDVDQAFVEEAQACAQHALGLLDCGCR